MYPNENFNTPIGPAECVSEPSLTDRLRENISIGADVAAMSRRIKSHLFGPENEKGDSCGKEPQCFRDELGLQRGQLLAAADALSDLPPAGRMSRKSYLMVGGVRGGGRLHFLTRRHGAQTLICDGIRLKLKYPYDTGIDDALSRYRDYLRSIDHARRILHNANPDTLPLLRQYQAEDRV